MINVVIPMAGQGSRFVKAGYKNPKPFIDVAGMPMIERVLENLKLKEANYYLIANEEHLRKKPELVERIQKSYPVKFIPISSLTEGTACTVLFAREFINNNKPLLIANSDQIVDINIEHFIKDCNLRKLDGSILTFNESSSDPKWSYAKTENGYVTEVKEKLPISSHATVGIYFFSQGNYFVDAAIDMIIHNDRTNNEFYTCPTYNYLINKKFKIGIYEMQATDMHGIGTPDDLKKYLDLIK